MGGENALWWNQLAGRHRGGSDQQDAPNQPAKYPPAAHHLSVTWYGDGMRTTIDKAGRVVIPAAVREKAGFTPGAELEVVEDELGVRLQRVATGPRLVKVGRRLVARPMAAPESRPAVDVPALIEDERNRWP